MNPIKAAIRYHRLRSGWLGDGGQPVPVPKAEARSETCLACPMHNSDRTIWEAVAKLVSHEMRLKADMNLHVSRESELHICDACDCFLGLKVWIEIEHIIATTDTKALYPGCWILKEMKTTT